MAPHSFNRSVSRSVSQSVSPVHPSISYGPRAARRRTFSRAAAGAAVVAGAGAGAGAGAATAHPPRVLIGRELEETRV
ncbi:hypothetical protein CLCR_09368 [Cladophialophora carrionii]|uniref:Uncharacterized protein n=1 Tax=Cladophialophora carrionii TaxID=86049 RepID=A0A1C1CTL2_9EURO|nr:hypothetical protein CLCR_09368 [Cladophialophora carrionii]